MSGFVLFGSKERNLTKMVRPDHYGAVRLPGLLYVESWQLELDVINRTSSWISWSLCGAWIDDLYECDPLKGAVRIEQDIFDSDCILVEWHEKLGGRSYSVDGVIELVRSLEGIGLPYLNTWRAYADGEIQASGG